MGESQRPPRPGPGLQQCAVCRSEFVIPVHAEAVEDDGWRLLLRCGECETYRDVVVCKAVAERYERDWKDGIAEVAAACARVEQEHMAADVEVLIAALQRDLIDAADFGRRWPGEHPRGETGRHP